MKCKLNDKCEFGDLCQSATRHDSITVLGCSSFKTKKPMTNEEHLKSCNTEQLAEFLALFDECNDAYREESKQGWIEWLKQPHNS